MTNTSSTAASFTLGQTVASRLRNAILAGHYQPGSRLTELGLAEDMQTSRTPVIAALKALTEQGLVRYASKRGYWVREFSIEEILEAYDIRATLEGMACRLAAEHGLNTAARALLEDCVQIGDRVVSGEQLIEQDHEAYRQMNVAFHNTILHASGNQQLGEFVLRANEIPLASDRIVMWTSIDIVRRSHDAHTRVLGAIANGQGTRAEMLMREHIYEAGQVLKMYWPEILAKAKNHELTDTAKCEDTHDDL